MPFTIAALIQHMLILKNERNGWILMLLLLFYLRKQVKWKGGHLLLVFPPHFPGKANDNKLLNFGTPSAPQIDWRQKRELVKEMMPTMHFLH